MAKHIHSIKLTPSQMEDMIRGYARHIHANPSLQSEETAQLIEQLMLLLDYRNYQIMGWMNDDKPF